MIGTKKIKFNRDINSNCSISSESISCTVLYGTTKPQALTTCIADPGTSETPATLSGDCVAPVSGNIGCYADGDGPEPTQKHDRGFYCTFWEQTTYNLESVNLVMNNLHTGKTLRLYVSCNHHGGCDILGRFGDWS